MRVMASIRREELLKWIYKTERSFTANDAAFQLFYYALEKHPIDRCFDDLVYLQKKNCIRRISNSRPARFESI